MKKGLLLLVLLAGQFGSAQAQHLVNGGFEDPVTVQYTTLNHGNLSLTGWTIGLEGVDVSGPSNPFLIGAPYEGSQYLDLDGSPGPGMISQTFATTAGMEYRLKFAYAMAYPNTLSASAAVRVYDSTGNLLSDLVSHSASIPGNLAWVAYDAPFTANGNLTTLEFRSESGVFSYGGLLLDGVEIVPEPSIVALCIVGIGAVLATPLIRRRAPGRTVRPTNPTNRHE